LKKDTREETISKMQKLLEKANDDQVRIIYLIILGIINKQ
jgi:hypothetical protein